MGCDVIMQVVYYADLNLSIVTRPTFAVGVSGGRLWVWVRDYTAVGAVSSKQVMR